MQSSCELADRRRTASTDFFSAIDQNSEPGDTTSEPGAKRVELCNPSSEGVLQRMFDNLYQSFSQLNAKLASKVEIKTASKCSDSVAPFDCERASGPRPPASGSPHSLDRISFGDEFRGSLEQNEDQGQCVAAADRCCMCLTAASDEELMMTPCCLRAVGSICFQEGLQENGKCCLCQVDPYKSNLPPLREPSDDTSDYKVHFVPATRQGETTYEAPLETSTVWCAEQSNSFSLGNTVADDPPPVLDFSEPLMVNATETQEKQNLIYSPNTEKVECELLTPLFKSQSFTQNPATQQWCEQAKNVQRKMLDTSNQTSLTVSALPKQSDISTILEERDNQTEEQVGHLTTTIHKLKLFDRDVIDYLKDIDEESLLDLVHSAFRERVHRTACKRFFQRAQVRQRRCIHLSICSTCSQDPDLIPGLKDGNFVFQSFVLTTQLRRYQVTVCHIQIGTMSIMPGSEKSKTIQTLLDNNASVLKSFRKPADIRGIHWNTSIASLKSDDYATITVTFSTAQQANEAIKHGILWNDERRECKGTVARLRITQCRNCQAYGHVFKECSSAARCCICAGMHLSTACTHNPTVEKGCLKCALCGGAHNATDDELCKTRKAERHRLLLKNQFYPTN